MSTLVFILLLLSVMCLCLTSFFTVMTIRILCEETHPKWKAVFPCLAAGLFLVISVELVINCEKLTQKHDFKRVIETESSAVIDTVVTKNIDNSQDTLYIYKFKD